MPEGDTIIRSARRLKPLMVNSTVVAANDNGRYFDSSSILDATIRDVEAKGKHLLVHFADGRVLHSHMGMTGSWHTYEPGERWRKPARWAALSMQVSNEAGVACCIVCYSPKTFELLSATQFRRHRHLNRLGPDLMHDGFDPDVVLSRFRVHDLASVGEAVMNQTIVCGIGNVYKSETLFLTKTNPFIRIRDLSDEKILTVVENAQSLMHKNVTGARRQTRLSSDEQRLWVYGRSRQPCFSCGTEIEMRRQGDLGRSTYWCPTCQTE